MGNRKVRDVFSPSYCSFIFVRPICKKVIKASDNHLAFKITHCTKKCILLCNSCSRKILSATNFAQLVLRSWKLFFQPEQDLKFLQYDVRYFLTLSSQVKHHYALFLDTRCITHSIREIRKLNTPTTHELSFFPVEFSRMGHFVLTISYPSLGKHVNVMLRCEQGCQLACSDCTRQLQSNFWRLEQPLRYQQLRAIF